MFRLAVFLALVSLGSLFFAHQKSSFIWSLIPPLSYLQFPWRFLAIATLSTSLLAGMFVYLVRDAKSKTVMVTVLVLLLFLFNLFTFRPRLWFDINDQDKFSGDLWEKQLTISIFDYLPIYAEAPPAQKAPEEPEILSGKAKIVTGEKGTDWQRWDISVESGSTVRLSLYDFPGWRVYVDSQKVDINHDNDLGLITFTLQPGEHEIFAKLTNTYPRTFGNIATILALLAVPLIIIKTKRK